MCISVLLPCGHGLVRRFGVLRDCGHHSVHSQKIKTKPDYDWVTNEMFSEPITFVEINWC